MSQPENKYDTDQFNQIAAITAAIDYKPRIVQCIQACNEEALIETCMLQFYDKVDKIIVIEGAVRNKVAAGQATEDGHSLDKTVEIIKGVKGSAEKNPDKKIVFVQLDRPWNDLEEIKNTFFQYMQDGDWMLITDADEFIMPDVVDELRKAITIEPWATEFVPAGFYHFWRDAHHIRKPSGDWGQQHQRFIRFQQGLNYVNHPVACDANGVCTYFHPVYLSRRYVLPSFYVYHYSYCKDDETDVAKKKEFYDVELGQEKHGDVGAYARGGQTDEYLERTEDLDTVLTFDEEHPPAMANHPMVARRDASLGMRDAKYLEQAPPPTGVMLTEDEDVKPVPLEHYATATPYSLDNIPLIWVYAEEGKQGYDRLYNTVEV